MSGHNKWSTIKRKKGAEDAKRGKIFTRVTREIMMAAREGSPDPDSNAALRLAVDKARAANMPKDNIERAINRGAGIGDDAVQMESIVYEGYGPGGTAIVIDVLTDNKNRTLADIKYVFNRNNGNMAAAGSVLWQFDQKGYIAVNADGVDYDELFLAAAEVGAEDVQQAEDDVYNIYTPREDLARVAGALREAGYKIEDSELTWVPKNEVELETQQAMQVMGLIEKLEDLDDIQGVASNLRITDEVAAALEAA
ncbi:YebC/PmpR family DNA-binding transcriptional regulator [Aggregatilinea lenta]|uniref:YebC/PmpR family DNA-binding transcriptional regulator n=1 Tax=Aggregatilinea lenta TaxID=913108 RepID=UPI000E5ABA14|nr:YebC/PmpR family DNA-binding transcriptional regulator [Aggregatilinea lenta]